MGATALDDPQMRLLMVKLKLYGKMAPTRWGWWKEQLESSPPRVIAHHAKDLCDHFIAQGDLPKGTTLDVNDLVNTEEKDDD